MVGATVSGVGNGRFAIFQNAGHHSAAHGLSTSGAGSIEMLVGILHGLGKVLHYILRPADVSVLLSDLADCGLRSLFPGIQAAHAVCQ
jgi:hypothetical protein